jgi:hypothetical protein
MSFLNGLFNRKRQTQNSNSLETEEPFLEEESEEEEVFQLNPGNDDITPSVSEASDTEETYEVVEREILPAKIICPDCGGVTLEGLEFCDKCGGELL